MDTITHAAYIFERVWETAAVLGLIYFVFFVVYQLIREQVLK